jgi:hypothetical protein
MSVRLVAQVALSDGTPDSNADALTERLASCADRVGEIQHSHAARNSTGSQGGGDLTWDLGFESDAACAALFERSGPVPGIGLVGALGAVLDGLENAVAQTDAVIIEPIAEQVAQPDLVGVKRTLLLRVREGTPAEQTAHFERDMLAMPNHVPAIRNWSFGRVRSRPKLPVDDHRNLERHRTMESHWTHVWEQEFATADGLLVDYMLSPYHWGFIDPWFDLECPQCIVETRLAHVFCPARRPVLCWGSPS